MKAYFRSAGLAAMAVLLAATSAGAMAWNDTDRPLPKPDRATYVAAARAFKTALGGQASPPTVADPAVRNFQDQALALSRILGTPALPLQPTDLFELCQPASEGFLAYAKANGSTSDDAIAANVTSRYRAEAIPLFLFSVHCTASVMPAMEAFLRQAGNKLSGSQADGGRMMRSGLFHVVHGMSGMIEDPRMGAETSERLIDVLAQDADGIAPYLSLDERAQLAGSFEALARTAPANQAARYARFLAALRSKDCQLLCSL